MATRTLLERDVQKAITDLLDVHFIPHWRMNAGDRFGSHNGKTWRIRGHAPGTADLLASPRIQLLGSTRRVPGWLWIEVKRPGKVQTPDQLRFETECIQRDHHYLLADDVDKVAEWLKEHGAL